LNHKAILSLLFCLLTRSGAHSVSYPEGTGGFPWE